MTTRTTALSKTIQAIREGLGVTTAELANTTGIRRPSIEAIERGRPVSDVEHGLIAAGFARLMHART